MRSNVCRNFNCLITLHFHLRLVLAFYTLIYLRLVVLKDEFAGCWLAKLRHAYDLLCFSFLENYILAVVSHWVGALRIWCCLRLIHRGRSRSRLLRDIQAGSFVALVATKCVFLLRSKAETCPVWVHKSTALIAFRLERDFLPLSRVKRFSHHLIE